MQTHRNRKVRICHFSQVRLSWFEKPIGFEKPIAGFSFISYINGGQSSAHSNLEKNMQYWPEEFKLNVVF